MSNMEKLRFYFDFPFVRYAFIVGILIALCSSLLGVTLVLKRFSFIGDGLSHVAFGAMSLSATLPVMIKKYALYLGKTVKAKGPFSYFQETDGREFFAVLISDATACCSQGIEFVLDGDHSYPADYPAIGTDITVVGKFNYYKEDYYTYCQLLDADMEVDQSLSW